MTTTTPAVEIQSRVEILPSYAPGLITTRTPLRISFAGGGTDLPDYYSREYGAVISTAIDKYVYVTVKRHSELFFEPIRINYSRTEQVNHISEIENNIARECLKLLRIEPPIFVSTVADMPASSGLGGSSAFAVGLLNALHAYRGEIVSAGQLAEEACHIEIEVLGQPIGKQDQYAAAFGGLNFFRFNPDGGVSVEPVRANGGVQRLFDHIMLFWTDIRRDANDVLMSQRQRIPTTLDSLREMRACAHRMHRLMCQGLDLREFAGILNENWRRKRSLAETISSTQIDRWYDAAIAAGAEGGKLCGAGGGGFLMFVVPPERRDFVRRALDGLVEIRVRPEPHGSRILSPFLFA